MKTVKRLPKSVRKNIRREKERIRKGDFTKEERRGKISKIYDFWRKRKIKDIKPKEEKK